MLHSMDQWFINPFRYKGQMPDGFDIAALNTDLDLNALTKDELLEYYLKIKSKLQSYLSTLTVTDLSVSPEGCTFSKLELLLGQFKHIMFHIGMIHGCILMETGEIPNYLGLSDPIEPSGGS